MFDRTHSQEGNPVVMAYPQPGPYPAYPQYPGQTGMPAKPPIPQTVQNAFYLMLAGAALQLVGMIVGFTAISKIKDAIRKQNLGYTDTQVNNAARIIIVGIVIVGLIEIGLWIWMAFANRSGKNWARITATVFFGLSCVFLIIGLAGSAASPTGTAKASAFSVVVSVLSWLVGLAAIIMLWNKQSGPYFKPPQFGVGGPGYPYPYAMPGQQPMPPAPGQPGPPPQQPADPWSNPPQQ